MPPAPPPPATSEISRPRECRVAVIHQTADARSHELRYGDQGASAQILCPGHKNLPGTVPVRARDRFPRFQQIAANDRQTFGSYRYGNNVSLASAQEDSRGSPATANVTGSRREISRQATRPASPQVPSHYRVFPLKSPVRLAVALMASVPAHHRPARASERR